MSMVFPKLHAFLQILLWTFIQSEWELLKLQGDKLPSSVVLRIASLHFEYKKWISKTGKLLVLKFKSKVTFRRI